MDNLNKYLLENRSSLDTDSPDDANWTSLSHKIGRMGRTHRMTRGRLASLVMAASLLLAAAGFTLWRMNGASAPPQAPEANVNTTATVPKAEAVSNTYSPVVLHELADLRKTSFYGRDRSVFKVFSLQWKALDANEKAIDEAISSVGPNDQLIRQLADNYELKIKLLRQFSVEIKKVKQYLPPADTLVGIPSLSLLSINTSNDEK